SDERSRDERVEGAGEPGQRAQLDVRPRPCLLAEPVHPDRGQPELTRGRDVVEEARSDVHVTSAIGAGSRVELLPVPVRRLVRADLRRDDGELEWNADALHRRVDEVTVGVGE